MFLLGFEFYNFYNREAVNKPFKLKLSKIIQQSYWFCILYLIFIPLFILNLRIIEVSNILTPTVLAILVFEHLNQEVYRLLIICGKPLLANSLLFIRYSALGIVFFETNSNLYRFIDYWLFGNIAASLVILLILIKKLAEIKLSFKNIRSLLYISFSVFKNKNWKPSLKVSARYLVSALSFRASTILYNLI